PLAQEIVPSPGGSGNSPPPPARFGSPAPLLHLPDHKASAKKYSARKDPFPPGERCDRQRAAALLAGRPPDHYRRTNKPRVPSPAHPFRTPPARPRVPPH